MKLGALHIGKACLAPCVAPQATMDSEDSHSVIDDEDRTATNVPLDLHRSRNHSMLDDDENDDYDQDDVENDDVEAQLPLEDVQPMSIFSLPSVQPADQVLEMSAALDLSDSSAILSRVANQSTGTNVDNKNSYNDTSSSLAKKRRRQQPQPDDNKGTSDDTSSIFPSKARLLRTLSRRPSMHETYDYCEPELRGQFIYYLYCFGILGTSLRIFLGRFFGGDCEFPDKINDFLSPLSRHICVTSSGRTIQRGGALFLDLPANMTGAFIMGLLLSLVPDNPSRSRFPWLRHDHQLQQHAGFHDALKVGLCGCLTSYASWNSQMLLMMEGTGTILGPQVVPALFGYMLGLVAATGSFITGGRVYEWIHNWSNQTPTNSVKRRRARRRDDTDDEQPQTSWDTDDSHGVHDEPEELADDKRQQQSSHVISERYSSLAHKVIPFVLCAGLLVWYGVADGVLHNQFYRQMWVCCLFTPLGVHLRWKLATFNGRGLGRNQRLDWVPWGTLASNVLASIVSVLLQGVLIKYVQSDQVWLTALVVGAKVGMAGSLSTVSSMVQETVKLSTIHPTHGKAYFYSCGTVLLTMSLGLCLYLPMMRAGSSHDDQSWMN